MRCFIFVSVLCVAASAHADQRGDEILKKAVAKYKATQSLSASFSVRMTVQGKTTEGTGTATLAKPNLFRIESKVAPDALMLSDGKVTTYYIPQANAYAQMQTDMRSMAVTVTAVAPFTLFFNPDKLVAPNTTSRYLGQETQEGVTYDLVEQILGQTTVVNLVAPSGIVTQMRVHVQQAGQTVDAEIVLSNVRLDVNPKPETFAFEIPKGAKQFDMPLPGEKALAVGTPAPTFAIRGSKNESLVLTDLLKKSKATLVTFWFVECASCRVELPKLEKLYGELKSKGLAVVAVNSGNDRASIVRYAKSAKLSFPLGLDDDGNKHNGVVKGYGVGVFPTTYILDSTGKIVFRAVGFDEAGIKAALAALGVN